MRLAELVKHVAPHIFANLVVGYAVADGTGQFGRSGQVPAYAVVAVHAFECGLRCGRVALAQRLRLLPDFVHTATFTLAQFRVGKQRVNGQSEHGQRQYKENPRNFVFRVGLFVDDFEKGKHGYHVAQHLKQHKVLVCHRQHEHNQRQLQKHQQHRGEKLTENKFYCFHNLPLLYECLSRNTASIAFAAVRNGS